MQCAFTHHFFSLAGYTHAQFLSKHGHAVNERQVLGDVHYMYS